MKHQHMIIALVVGVVIVIGIAIYNYVSGFQDITPAQALALGITPDASSPGKYDYTGTDGKTYQGTLNYVYGIYLIDTEGDKPLSANN